MFDSTVLRKLRRKRQQLRTTLKDVLEREKAREEAITDGEACDWYKYATDSAQYTSADLALDDVERRLLVLERDQPERPEQSETPERERRKLQRVKPPWREG